MSAFIRIFSVIVLAAGCCAASAQQTEQDRLARDIFKQLIEINTTDSNGNVTTAADAMAARLRAAGFSSGEVIVDGPNARKKNLVVRYRGTGKRKPVLFIGHLDVVEAKREDWSMDPFRFIEKEGYFYGRGTQDMKAGDAMLVANFIRLKREGYMPDRDLIVALTADEEGGAYNGVEWLLKHHRDWIDAAYCINLDGGEFDKRKGKRLLAQIQASEKVYADFRFESRNSGGHSSVPTPDNAIYHLAAALLRVRDHEFPVAMSEITKNYFEQMGKIEGGPEGAAMERAARDPKDEAAIAQLSKNAFYHSLLHTTCVATLLHGGHAPNALPQMAEANVNCRIFPGEEPEAVQAALERAVADPKVTITMVTSTGSDGQRIPIVAVPPSPLLPEVVEAEKQTADGMWPGLPVVASMSTGATDGKYLRIAGIPTYGIACMFYDMDDDRAHGKDERIGIQDFYDGVKYNYRLMKALSGALPVGD